MFPLTTVSRQDGWHLCLQAICGIIAFALLTAYSEFMLVSQPVRVILFYVIEIHLTTQAYIYVGSSVLHAFVGTKPSHII